MPFTVSHAAAALPAVRRDGSGRGRGRGRLVPAVLVTGSFAPDVAYYAAAVLPGGMESGGFTHSLPGAVTVDVLISWALTGLWLLVRELSPALLPRLGALTHVVWDAFTHHDRWGTRLVPALGRDRPAGVPLFTWLQYGSSVAGVVTIAVFMLGALRRAPDGDRRLCAGRGGTAGGGLGGAAGGGGPEVGSCAHPLLRGGHRDGAGGAAVHGRGQDLASGRRSRGSWWGGRCGPGASGRSVRDATKTVRVCRGRALGTWVRARAR